MRFLWIKSCLTLEFYFQICYNIYALFKQSNTHTKGVFASSIMDAKDYDSCGGIKKEEF